MPEALIRMALISPPRFPGNKFRPDIHHVTQRNGNSQIQVTRVRITLFAPEISFLVNPASSPSTSPALFNFLSSINGYGVTMTPSLQELIDFLLNEVALCGSQGVHSSNLSDPLFFSMKYMPDAPSFIRQWNMHVSRRCIFGLCVGCTLHFLVFPLYHSCCHFVAEISTCS